jgi:hypothetical protein
MYLHSIYRHSKYNARRESLSAEAPDSTRDPGSCTLIVLEFDELTQVTAEELAAAGLPPK